MPWAQGTKERQQLLESGISRSLEILSEIHSGIHRCNLIGISVEGQCLSFEKLPETPFGSLAPSRMVHSRVDVRVEPIFIWRYLHPGCSRLFFDETNPSDRLDPFEAVLPWNDQPNRRAVWIWKRLFAVESNGQNRQRIHRLVQAQTFNVRPLQNRAALLRQLIGCI